jgi:hypothetical protein
VGRVSLAALLRIAVEGDYGMRRGIGGEKNISPSMVDGTGMVEG